MLFTSDFAHSVKGIVRDPMPSVIDHAMKVTGRVPILPRAIAS